MKNHILSFGRNKKDEKPISSSEVTRDLFSNIWKEHLDEVRTMAGEIQSEKLASIKKHGKKILLKDTEKSVQLSLLKNK